MFSAEHRAMFLFGAIGGILPTVATMASTYVTLPDTPPPAIGLFIGLALWAFVGGVVAITNASPEVRQAIFAGIAAPALLTNLISGASEAHMRKRTAELLPTVGLLVGAVSFVPSALAQEYKPDVAPQPTVTDYSTVVISPRI